MLSEVIGQVQTPVAWVSLDEGDNDPIRFWTYLIAATGSIQAGVGESALALLRMAQPLPVEAVPEILINDLARLDLDLALILDDFHAIHNESIHTAFTFLLEHLPHNLHLVVSTRLDPPWPLARFRARNQLVELRANDLRFSVAEAAEFLNQTMRLILSAENVAALEARTEGWIAGLQLAALSMQGRSDLDGFVKAFTGSHAYVAEYLLEEVLQGQPVEMQAFLLKTSLLECLSAGLCDSVTGRQDSGAVLGVLQRANLFVIPLDDENIWFRYHHLFADLLQARLQQVQTPEAIADLHQRAAEWYEGKGYVVEAVNHALAARDFNDSARLIGQHAHPMITRGELVTLMRWIDALPEEVISSHPMVTIAKAWALTLQGAIRQVEPLLQQAEAKIEMGDETIVAREFLGNAAAIRAFFAMMAGEYPRALELAELAQALLPEHSVHVHWLLPYTLGASYRGRGQYERAMEAFERLARMGELGDNLIIWATGVTEVAIVSRHQGRLRKAGEISRQALQKIEERGELQFGSIAKLEVPLIEVLREQNELEEAYQRVNGVIARMQSWPMPTDRIFAYLALVHVQEAQGDFLGAFETLRVAKDLKANHPVLMNLARSVDLTEIRLSIAMGDVTAASRMMDELHPVESGMLYLRDQELLLLARLRLAQGKPGEAERIISPLAIDAQAGERIGALIEILALQACVLNEQSHQQAALAALTKALALAEPEGFVRVFLDEGQGMRQLLAAVGRSLAASKDPASSSLKAYVTRLLDAFRGSFTPGVPAPSGDKIDGLVEGLSAREIEVLELVAAGDSNRAIAEKLVITVSAVKKHTANIYGKLNVNSRTQAVARARQLGLLPNGEENSRSGAT